MSQQLGSLLQQWRRDRQLSLGALAARAGLSKGTLSGWEQGRHQPRLPELDALFSALEATTHQQREALNLIRAPRAWQSLAALSSPASADLEAAAFPVPGHLLRALRLRRGLTLEAVAQLMGVDRSTVSRWERSLSTPSADRFPRLLDLLGARAEERSALVSGQNLSLPAAADRPLTMDELEQQLFTLERPVLHGDRRLLDLEFLAWQSEIWPQAARTAAARELLAMGWAFYAEWLTWDGRLREAGYCARRAIDLVQSEGRRTGGCHPAIECAVHVAGEVAAQGTGRSAPAAAVRWLALWLPAAAGCTHWEATLYRDMAGAAWAAGQAEAALDFAERACFLAEWLGDESLYGYCRDGKADLLLQAGLSTRALDYLSPPGPNEVPYDRIQKILRWARLLWDQGDRTAADWLSEAYELIDRFNYVQFRVPADALAREFRSGC